MKALGVMLLFMFLIPLVMQFALLAFVFAAMGFIAIRFAIYVYQSIKDDCK